jgi:hypothetical protein
MEYIILGGLFVVMISLEAQVCAGGIITYDTEDESASPFALIVYRMKSIWSDSLEVLRNRGLDNSGVLTANPAVVGKCPSGKYILAELSNPPAKGLLPILESLGTKDLPILTASPPNTCG